MRRISARNQYIALKGLVLTGLCLTIILGGCAGPKRLPPVDVQPPPDLEPPVGTPTLLGVGLLENEKSLDISANGAAVLLDGHSGNRLARLDGPGIVVCSRSGSQVTWLADGKKGTAGTLILKPVDPGHRVLQGEFAYRGAFLVRPTPGGSGLTLVNNLDLESYLRGVVPWEIGRHGREKLAALEAQAVAARTYTISHLGTRKSRGFDVYASVQDQVYKGAKDEDPLCNYAVESTTGLVLRHEDQEIEAYYSACCGGVSSNVEEVWARGPQPYLVSHPDSPGKGDEAYCATSRHFDWRESWTAGRLEEIMQKTLPEYVDYMTKPGRSDWAGPVFSPRDGSSAAKRPGRLRNLEILERTTSGRVARLAVTTDAGVYHVRGDRVRWVLKPASGNPFILRSALFEVELVRDGDRLVEVAARGRGYGHGIGLCQTGALAMAERGKNVREILVHYYPGADLAPVGR
ncbi:MAG: SpoIID/LytB domain-containing protein [Candidatus Krumholzibacteriota bacterium]